MTNTSKSDTSMSATPKRRLSPGRSKAIGVVVLLALAGALFAVSGRTWITAEAASPIGASSAVAVTGTQATAVLPALAAALAAAALALSIARRVARIIVSSIMIVVSGVWIATAVTVAADPGTAANAQVRDTTGLAESSEHAAIGAWPVIGIVVAALLVIVAAVVLVTGRRWETGGTRFERAGAHEAGPADAGTVPDELDPSTTWDALTRGDDPS